MILESTRTATVRVGGNLRGHAPGANWRLLLPNLERPMLRFADGLPPASVRTLRDAGDPDDSGPEVVVGGSSRASRRIAKTGPGELRRLVTPATSVYLDLGGPFRRSRAMGTASRASEAIGRPLRSLWVTPQSGEVESIVPSDDLGTAAFFAGHGLVAEGPAKGKVSRVARGLRSAANRIAGREKPVGSARGRLVALGPPADAGGGPPAYLVSLGREAGIDIAHHRWGLWAPRDYASQKAVFFLFRDDARTPEYVVKIARDPALNPRLANEQRSLELLSGSSLAAQGLIPRPAFFGTHAGLAILGEGAIDGTAFRDATEATPRCPHAMATVARLADLAEATAVRVPAADVAGALKELVDSFCGIYALATTHRDVLDRQLDALAASVDPVPSVFLHGDLGVWNILVRTTGGVTFLDWEASEPAGVPLWDLFAFMRSHSVWVGRRAGIRDAAKAFERAYLETSELNDVIVDATARTCERIGLAASLVEPLFHLTWVHRALREASRLRPGYVNEGTFIRVLRRCIEAREAPGLRRLFAPHADRSRTVGA